MPVVAHLSDVHFGANDPRLADSLLADLASLGPDLVVVSGDLTQRATTEQLTEARAFLDQIDRAILVIPGNHDVPLFDLPARLLSPTRRFETLVSADRDPLVHVPGIVALGLDSMPRWRWKAGHISKRQASRVVETLSSCPTGVWRLLVTHHPVLPDHLSSMIGRAELIEACGATHVNLLLSGHTHTPRTDVVSLGVGPSAPAALAIGAGTAISHRTREVENAYTLIELGDPSAEGASITVRVRTPDHLTWRDHSMAHFLTTAEGVRSVDGS